MELFDMVKAAPPPKTISGADRTSPPSPIPPDSPDGIAITGGADADDLLEGVTMYEYETDTEENEDNNQPDSPSLAKRKSEKSRFKSQQNIQQYNENMINDVKIELNEEDYDDLFMSPSPLKQPSATDKKTPGKSRDLEESEALEGIDSDGSSDGGYSKTLTAPTKTKAQQKMFSDLLDQSTSRSCASEFHAREFRIRIRRLTQSEIDAASASVAQSMFGSSGPRKRGRPRKSGDDQQSRSPAKKPKVSPPKIHIKVPLQYGAKNRALANMARTHTPPPILSSRLKSKPKPRSPPKVSPKLVRRYGKRFFSCVVNVKKLKWPSKSPERNRKRAKRSNLSVSFNESVEILGSGSRRSTFGPISFKSPKPTRLQRVDATGNVLEDIELTSNMVLTGNSPTSSTAVSSATRGRGKRRSCNGSPQLKRRHQRIPLSGLASLRLDDGPNGEDDEEYIVPNELPGVQRPGTPTPRKKKISYTTTISDDEDDTALPKKSKEVNASKKVPKTKPNQKKIEKSTSLKESVLQNVIPQDKSTAIVKEREVKEAAVVLCEDDRVAETEVQKVAETTNAVKDGEESETKKSVDTSKDNPQKSAPSVDENGEKNPVEELKAEKTDVVAGESLDMPALEFKEAASSQEKDNKAEITDEKAEKTDDKAEQKDDEAEQKDDEAKQTDDKAEQKDDEAEQTDDKAEQREVDDLRDLMELVTPPSQTLPPTTEETPDDVLEIQTSLDDVRQLHTPFSSQQSTPQAPKLARRDSGDSDCSFKSAHDPNKDFILGHVNAEGNTAAGEEDVADAATGEDKSKTDPAAMPAVLTTPPPSTPRTVNGCDPTRNDGSSIATVFYSPLESMPSLDDEVLGQLVEPDLLLTSSRHAISRGTLDDIMTALES